MMWKLARAESMVNDPPVMSASDWASFMISYAAQMVKY